VADAHVTAAVAKGEFEAKKAKTAADAHVAATEAKAAAAKEKGEFEAKKAKTVADAHVTAAVAKGEFEAKKAKAANNAHAAVEEILAKWEAEEEGEEQEEVTPSALHSIAGAFAAAGPLAVAFLAATFAVLVPGMVAVARRARARFPDQSRLLEEERLEAALDLAEE